MASNYFPFLLRPLGSELRYCSRRAGRSYAAVQRERVKEKKKKKEKVGLKAILLLFSSPDWKTGCKVSVRPDMQLHGPWFLKELQLPLQVFPQCVGAGGETSAGTRSRSSPVPLAGVTGKPGISEPRGWFNSLILHCHLISIVLPFPCEYGFWQYVCCLLHQAHLCLALGTSDIKPFLLNKRGPLCCHYRALTECKNPSWYCSYLIKRVTAEGIGNSWVVSARQAGKIIRNGQEEKSLCDSQTCRAWDGKNLQHLLLGPERRWGLHATQGRLIFLLFCCFPL